jgi:hypothetical protein
MSEQSDHLLVTVSDFAAVDGVVDVLDVTPDVGAVTLVLLPGRADEVRAAVTGRHMDGLLVVIQEAERP